MSSFVKRWLKDDAVLWVAAGSVSDQGRPQVSAAADIKCRWEETTGEILSQSGETVGFSDVVIVKQDIDEGSILWQGTTSDLPSPITDITKLRQVVKTVKIPDLKGRVAYRKVILMKYSDTLPDII